MKRIRYGIFIFLPWILLSGCGQSLEESEPLLPAEPNQASVMTPSSTVHPSQPRQKSVSDWDWPKTHPPQTRQSAATEQSNFLGPRTHIVTASALNMRKGPGLQYKVTDRLRKGQSVRVLEETRGWSQVKPGSWVSTRYLRPLNLPQKVK